MKTIGLLGGMSWESTLNYYSALNRGVKAALGGLHSAKICMYSVDFEEIARLQQQNDWGGAADILVLGALAVERGGADFLLICTNTMHKVAPEIKEALTIPLLHIADATAQRLVADGVGRVGLLGTRFTMEETFYMGRLQEEYGLQVVVPEPDDMDLVHRVIYSELCLGTVSDVSRQEYLRIITSLHSRGAEAVILGCTEIALLVQKQHTSIPLYDTTEIHATAAVALALV